MQASPCYMPLNFKTMTIEEAKQIVNINEKTFDVSESVFGGDAVTIEIADEFDNKEAAQKFLEALRLLCA